MVGKSATLDQGLDSSEGQNGAQGSQDLQDDVEGILELIVDSKNLVGYQTRVNNRFLRIEDRIGDLFLQRKIKSDQRRLELLKEKLARLKKMKLQVELQKEQKYRLRELEKFKRA